MVLHKEEEVLTTYLKNKNLKLTNQRRVILKLFLNTEIHVTAEELYEKLKHTHPEIGIATVYRTLKLFCDAGLALEVQFGDGFTRYEHHYGHGHHDHLVCEKCGKYIEVIDERIEKLQQSLAEQNNFHILRHRMELYGLCKDCFCKK